MVPGAVLRYRNPGSPGGSLYVTGAAPGPPPGLEDDGEAEGAEEDEDDEDSDETGGEDTGSSEESDAPPPRRSRTDPGGNNPAQRWAGEECGASIQTGSPRSRTFGCTPVD